MLDRYIALLAARLRDFALSRFAARIVVGDGGGGWRGWRVENGVGWCGGCEQ